jgi:hypothetical protein
MFEHLEARRLLSGAEGDVIEPESIEPLFVYDYIASRDGHIAGTFGYFEGKLTADEYTASIHWDDGTESPGQVVAYNDGSYGIVGSHGYASRGRYVTNAYVFVSGEYVGSTIAWVVAHADTPIVTESPNLAYWTGTLPHWVNSYPQDTTPDGTPAGTYVGSFYDIDHPSSLYPGGEDGSAYNVTIDWGDGTQSAGTATADCDGSYLVYAPGHAYAAAGNFNVSFTASPTDHSATVTGTDTAEVIDASRIIFQSKPEWWNGDLWNRDRLVEGVPLLEFYIAQTPSAANVGETGALPAPQAPARSLSLFELNGGATSIAQQVFKSDQNVKELSDGPTDPLS